MGAENYDRVFTLGDVRGDGFAIEENICRWRGQWFLTLENYLILLYYRVFYANRKG